VLGLIPVRRTEEEGMEEEEEEEEERDGEKEGMWEEPPPPPPPLSLGEGWRAAKEGRPGPVCEGRDLVRGAPIPSKDVGMVPARAAERGPGICSGPPVAAAGVRDTCTA